MNDPFEHLGKHLDTLLYEWDLAPEDRILPMVLDPDLRLVRDHSWGTLECIFPHLNSEDDWSDLMEHADDSHPSEIIYWAMKGIVSRGPRYKVKLKDEKFKAGPLDSLAKAIRGWRKMTSLVYEIRRTWSMKVAARMQATRQLYVIDELRLQECAEDYVNEHGDPPAFHLFCPTCDAKEEIPVDPKEPWYREIIQDAWCCESVMEPDVRTTMMHHQVSGLSADE